MTTPTNEIPIAVTPVILSGGSGTRLWPLSLDRQPKQLQRLIDDHTMIQATARRMGGTPGVTAPMVICNSAQVDAVGRQLVEIGCPPREILVEPTGRNTAPAVAAAALRLPPEAVMAVLPADHVIADVVAFQKAMTEAVTAAADGAIVVFGVEPTRPDTGFGYLEIGQLQGPIAELARFVEKPDAATAVRYLATGRYLWNSGMFVFTAGAILAELERHVPDVLASVRAAVATADVSDAVVELGEEFGSAASVSLDHAVMEETDIGRVVFLDAGWSDVGSWDALWEVASPTGETVTVGPVHTVDVARSYVRSQGRPVAVIGLDDVVVVETPDAVLVMDRRRAQDVRSAAQWFAGLGDARAGDERESHA